MSSSVIAIGLVVVVVVAVVVGVWLIRRPKDGVDSFRRQIDALSPEARRTVVDQVQHAAGRSDADAEEPADKAPSTESAETSGSNDADGADDAGDSAAPDGDGDGDGEGGDRGT